MDAKTVTNTFYKEHTDDPRSWLSPRPAFDVEKFQKELERRGGTIGSIPRFRLRWAGECDEYIIEEYDTLEGYFYRDEKGIEHHVSASDTEFEFPEGAIPAPNFESHKVFIPRWVIEEYHGPFYAKFWTVQELEQTGYESGRVDIMSYYRAPSEVDLKMIEQYAYLQDHLNADDIRNGIEVQKALQDKQRYEERAEMIDEITEETAKALTDGIPNSTRFAFNPSNQFDIKDYSNRVMEAHNNK